MKSHPGSGSKLGINVIIFKPDLVIPGSYFFIFMTVPGSVCIRAEMALEFTCARHYRDSGELPGMDMAECPDFILIVKITGTPGTYQQGVRAEVHHPERTAG